MILFDEYVILIIWISCFFFTFHTILIDLTDHYKEMIMISMLKTFFKSYTLNIIKACLEILTFDYL